jgi:hypothetical protein
MNNDDRELEMKIIEILGDANKSIYQQKLMEYMKDCEDINDLFNKLRYDQVGLELLQELRSTTIGVDKILEARYQNLRDNECETDINIGFGFNPNDDSCLN